MWCFNNELTNLDVSNNLALIALNCEDNQLTSIDVSANTALIQLVCSQNELTSLDVSNNTALYSLRCYNNQLTSLNIRNGNNTNMSASTFQANGNPLLTTINCDDVAYATLTYTVAYGTIDTTMTTWTAIP